MPLMTHQKNNFDFLRLLFASFVIITHSYALTGMSGENDWLGKLTNGQTTFSYIGVMGFFSISGFLIFQSLTRSKNVIDYYWKRVLRIYPALLVVLLLTVLLAVIPYPYGVHHYLHNPSVKSYFLNNITLFRIQFSIDGLFQDTPVKGAINGSLWTIPYEFFFYIILSLLFLVKKGLEKYVLLTVLMFLLNLYFYKDAKPWTFLYLDSKYIIELGVFFVSGSVLAAFEIQKFSHQKTLCVIALVLMILSFNYLTFSIFKFFSLPMLVILFGLSSTKYLSDIGEKIGDISYGVYIYGYPVQQTLMHYFKFNALQLMICSLFITFILGFLSWHLVEKRALKLKNLNPALLFKPSVKGRPEQTNEKDIAKKQEIEIS